MEIYFENHKSIIEKELLQANKSALIAVAWINFKEYKEIFEKMIANSVELKIICSDNEQNKSHQKQIDELIKLGAKIKLLKMPRTSNHMHHKFAIIDDITILNGSFNWSPNAAKSIENISIIKNSPDVVTKFLSEFERLFLIESKTLKVLQKTFKKCKIKGCNGKLFYFLVLEENPTAYFELDGIIAETCNYCGICSIVEDIIPNKHIELLNNFYENSSGEGIEIELINRSINSELDSYTANEIIIHAIGRVKTGLSYDGEDYFKIIIIWKNKFVGDQLPNYFDENSFADIYHVKSSKLKKNQDFEWEQL